MATTLDRLRPIVAGFAFFAVDDARITPEANLADDLGCDSLDRVELALEVEQTFDLDLTDDDVENIRTVADLVRLVDAKTGKAAA